MERPRTEDGRQIDALMPGRSSLGQHYDPWGHECTFGRWGELNGAIDDPSVRAAVGVPEDDSWWRIGYDTIGDVAISTRWIGIPLGLTSRPRTPLLYETMIAGAIDVSVYGRYYTRDEADAGHKRCVRELQGG